MRGLEEVSALLAEKGYWLQLTHSDDGRWSWCAGHNNADLTGGNGDTALLAVADVWDRLEAGRFDQPARLDRIMREGLER